MPQHLMQNDLKNCSSVKDTMHTHLYIQIYICKGLMYIQKKYIYIYTSVYIHPVQIPVYILNKLQCLRMQLALQISKTQTMYPWLPLTIFHHSFGSSQPAQHSNIEPQRSSLPPWRNDSNAQSFLSDNPHQISALFDVLGSQLFEGIIHNLHQYPKK